MMHERCRRISRECRRSPVAGRRGGSGGAEEIADTGAMGGSAGMGVAVLGAAGCGRTVFCDKQPPS
jgi:hypothetical protein